MSDDDTLLALHFDALLALEDLGLIAIDGPGFRVTEAGISALSDGQRPHSEGTDDSAPNARS
jgi:hypothetical protein